MNILEIMKIPYYKEGNTIHIKKENRGKFTRSAKEHNMGVQEFATHVLNNKDKYNSTLVKRANFAKNAKKFKHAKGGLIKKCQEGEILDNQQMYTAGYADPVTVTANKKLTKRQQTQADEEWREYLKQHPIQIGSEEYNRLPEKAKAQVYKNSVTNAIDKAALPTAAAIVAPTALTAGVASLIGSGALTVAADAVGKVGTKIARTNLGQATSSFINNPYIDIVLTASGAYTVPTLYNSGISNIKQGNYGRALGDFASIGLEGLGVLGTIKNIKNASGPINRMINGVQTQPYKEITGYEPFTLDFDDIEDLGEFKKYIPEVINKYGQKRLRDFYNNVTLKKYYTNRGIFHNKYKQEDIPGEFIFLKKGDPRIIKGSAGHSQFGNAYIYEMSDDYEGTVIHEGIHNKRDNNKEVFAHQLGQLLSLPDELKNKVKEQSLSMREVFNKYYTPLNSSYTPDEINILKEAYHFNDLETANKKHDVLAETAATNTELQYYIFKNFANGDPSKLNNAIDNLSDEKLLTVLEQLNGYGQSFAKYIKSLGQEKLQNEMSKIRNALKIVPVAATPLLLNNKKQEQYKNGGIIKFNPFNKFKL